MRNFHFMCKKQREQNDVIKYNEQRIIDSFCCGCITMYAPDIDLTKGWFIQSQPIIVLFILLAGYHHCSSLCIWFYPSCIVTVFLSNKELFFVISGLCWASGSHAQLKRRLVWYSDYSGTQHSCRTTWNTQKCKCNQSVTVPVSPRGITISISINVN